MSNAAGRATLDGFRFLRSLILRPRTIGAIVPSSSALARRIALQIDPRAAGPVLELGPGTGVVTQALVDRGFGEERLVAIEADPDLARLVSQRFPRVQVIVGDAFNLDRCLADVASDPFAAIVSGLPLLNQPPERRRALVEAALARVRSRGAFVQFSYGLFPPVPADAEITVERAGLVMANLPPARIWVYRRT